MEYLIKLLEHENEGRTIKLFIKITYWINCISLSIFIAESQGYKINNTSFEFSSIINLLTEHILVLGLISFITLTTFFTIVVSFIINFTSHHILGRFEDNQSFSNKKAKKQLRDQVFQSQKELRIHFQKTLTKQDAKIKYLELNNTLKSGDIERWKDSLEVAAKMMITTSLVNELVIANKFPNLHFLLVSIFLVLASVVLIYKAAQDLYLWKFWEYTKIRSEVFEEKLKESK